jgi:iron complex transport system ATP-binding protein
MEKVLDIQNAATGYHQAGQTVYVSQGINFDALKAELVSLVGPNGVGKSTLLKSVTRQQKLMSGEIRLCSKNLNEYSTQQLARLVSFVSTEPVRVRHMKTEEIVALGRFPYTGWLGVHSDEDKIIIDQAIGQVGIDHLRGKYIDNLSDGERQKVMIARSIAQNTPLIVLDEPTAFLDLPNRFEIIDLLHRLCQEQQKTILFSTHDFSIATQYADKIWLMSPLQTVQGAPEDLMWNGCMANVFQNNRIEFDIKRAEFIVKRSNKRFIGFSSEGTWRMITLKALSRLGYGIDSKAEMQLELVPIEGGVLWKLKNKGDEKIFQTIYELSLHLKIH